MQRGGRELRAGFGHGYNNLIRVWSSLGKNEGRFLFIPCYLDRSLPGYFLRLYPTTEMKTLRGRKTESEEAVYETGGVVQHSTNCILQAFVRMSPVTDALCKSCSDSNLSLLHLAISNTPESLPSLGLESCSGIHLATISCPGFLRTRNEELLMLGSMKVSTSVNALRAQLAGI